METPRAPIEQQLGGVPEPTARKIGRFTGIIFRRAIEVGKAVAKLPFYCGYANLNGNKSDVHDHQNGKKKVGRFITSDYDPVQHGELEDWLDEGGIVPEVPKSVDGKVPIHRHDGKSSFGVHEYNYE